jgi:uncharacterized protein (DUF736 family)
LSAWIKTPKNGGEKYMSLSVGKPKEQRAASSNDAQREAAPFNDDIPF